MKINIHVVEERPINHFDFIFEILNIFTLVAIHNSKDIHEKENVIENYKYFIKLNFVKIKSQLSEFMEYITHLQVKNKFLASAIKLIVSYTKNEINFNSFFEKTIDILNGLMKEVVINNDKDAIEELNHLYEYMNSYSEKINKTKKIYISNNLKKETKSEKDRLIENYEKDNSNLKKEKENHINRIKNIEKEINDLNEKIIREKLDKQTFKEINSNLIQKLTSMESKINYLMEQHKKDEYQKKFYK